MKKTKKKTEKTISGLTREDILEAVRGANKEQSDFMRTAAELNRRQLGSIDLTDARQEEDLMDEGKRKQYVSELAFVYKKYVEGEINKFIVAQEDLMAMGFLPDNPQTYAYPFYIKPDDVEKQIIFSRGTLNGLMLVREFFERAYNEHQGDSVVPPNFDKYKIMSEE